MGNALIERGPKTVGQMTHCWLAWSSDYPSVCNVCHCRQFCKGWRNNVSVDIYSVPTTMLDTWINISFNGHKIRWGSYCYHPHFTSKEITWDLEKLNSLEVGQLEFRPLGSSSETLVAVSSERLELGSRGVSVWMLARTFTSSETQAVPYLLSAGFLTCHCNYHPLSVRVVVKSMINSCKCLALGLARNKYSVYGKCYNYSYFCLNTIKSPSFTLSYLLQRYVSILKTCFNLLPLPYQSPSSCPDFHRIWKNTWKKDLWYEVE